MTTNHGDDNLDAIFKHKRMLRTQVKKVLKAIDPSLRSQQDNDIQNIILGAPWFKSSIRLCAYISCSALREVDTSKLLSEILNDPINGGKKLYVPRVEDNNSHMRMLNISRIDDLVANSMDILEPAPFDSDGNAREDVTIQLTWVPHWKFGISVWGIWSLAPQPQQLAFVCGSPKVQIEWVRFHQMYFLKFIVINQYVQPSERSICAVMLVNDPVDLFLLPGLAFDRSGRRIGRGGGYYDTFLENYQELAKKRNWKQPLLVALSYSEQILEEGVIPITPSDVPIDALVSPEGVIPINTAAFNRYHQRHFWHLLTEIEIEV
ncbi:hypothetical protein Lal_00030142 [Lupinus albus]|nr:hypothetical protein Lal_00030142 [Lupinus albus]